MRPIRPRVAARRKTRRCKRAARPTGGLPLAGKSRRPSITNPQYASSETAASDEVTVESTAAEASFCARRLSGDVAASEYARRVCSCPFPGDHSNRPQGARRRRTVRDISDCVLITNVACDAFADCDHLIGPVGEEGLTSGGPASRRSTSGFRSASSSSKMPMVYTKRWIERPFSVLRTDAAALALSPPSLITIRTFFSGPPAAILVQALYDGVVKRCLTRGRVLEIARSSSSARSVKLVPTGRPSVLSR